MISDCVRSSSALVATKLIAATMITATDIAPTVTVHSLMLRLGTSLGIGGGSLDLICDFPLIPLWLHCSSIEGRESQGRIKKRVPSMTSNL